MSPERMWELMRESERLETEGKYEESLEVFRKTRSAFEKWLSSDDQGEAEDE